VTWVEKRAKTGEGLTTLLIQPVLYRNDVCRASLVSFLVLDAWGWVSSGDSEFYSNRLTPGADGISQMAACIFDFGVVAHGDCRWVGMERKGKMR
jgi:hypothetical protein